MTQMLVLELALCHREMMGLMHRTTDQETDKPEPANVLSFLRIGRRDCEKLAAWQRGSIEGGEAWEGQESAATE
jgi:hypothetical protein